MNPFRRAPILALILAMVVIAAACGDSDDGIDATDGGLSIEGRQFWSTSVVEDGVDRPVVEGSVIALRFDESSVGATAGCNSMFGDYQLDGDVLVVDGMGSTEIGCDPERHAQDEFVAEVLTSRPSLILDGDRLTLTTTSVVMELLDKRVADPDRSIIGTQWQVTGFITGDAAVSMAIETPGYVVFDDQSSMRGNDGCVDFTASVEVSDGSTGGPVEGDGELQFGPRDPAADTTSCGDTTDYADHFALLFATNDGVYTIDGPNLTILNRDGAGVTFRAQE